VVVFTLFMRVSLVKLPPFYQINYGGKQNVITNNTFNRSCSYYYTFSLWNNHDYNWSCSKSSLEPFIRSDWRRSINHLGYLSVKKKFKKVKTPHHM